MSDKIVVDSGEEVPEKKGTEKPSSKHEKATGKEDKKVKDKKDCKIVESLQTEINRLREEITQLNLATQSRTDSYVQSMIAKIENLTTVVIEMKEKAEATLLQSTPSISEPPAGPPCSCISNKALTNSNTNACAPPISNTNGSASAPQSNEAKEKPCCINQPPLSELAKKPSCRLHSKEFQNDKLQENASNVSTPTSPQCTKANAPCPQQTNAVQCKECDTNVNTPQTKPKQDTTVNSDGASQKDKKTDNTVNDTQSQHSYLKEVAVECEKRQDELNYSSQRSPSYSMLVSKNPARKEGAADCENQIKDELNYSAQKSPSYSTLVAKNPATRGPADVCQNPSFISDNFSNMSLLPEYGAAKQTQTMGLYVNGSYPSTGGSTRSETGISCDKVYTSSQVNKRIKEIVKNRKNNEVFLTILSWTNPMDYRVNVSDKKSGHIVGSFDIKECTFQLAYREGVFDDYETQFIVHYFLRKQRKCSQMEK